MSDAKRTPWSEGSNRQLIEYWETVGSIVLIAMLLGRSPSSVQTQASRLGLPRRAEGKDRHRRRWTPEDESLLFETVKECTLPDGRVRIAEVASRMERSVDAIVARLVDDCEDEQAFLRTIELPSARDIGVRVEARQRAVRKSRALATASVLGANGPSASRDNRNEGRMRPCLCCENPFWSDGAHNRVCNKCKRDDGGWEW